MERKKYLIVTAGGTGTRMGAPVPKQFLELTTYSTIYSWRIIIIKDKATVGKFI